MIKKFIAIVFATVLVFSFVPTMQSSADDFNMSAVNEEFAIVVDASSPSTAICGMEKNADMKAYPASTTKILTCMIALERCQLSDTVNVSAVATDFSIQNSLMGLVTGEQCTVEDILYGLMLVSGNDAAVAIAEHISGSSEAFAEVMNQKAQEIGMANSHFVTPNGRHNDDHYTTARDMAVLTAYALKNDAFRKIVGTTEYTTAQTNMSAPRTLKNSNRLLVDLSSDEFTPASCLYPDAIGVKTGDTDKAGKCLVAAAERDGVTLIAVLFNGSQTNSTMTPEQKDERNVRRFNDAIALFDFAFNSMVETVTVAELVSLGLPTTFSVQSNNYAEGDPQQGKLDVTVQLDPNASVSLMSGGMAQLKADLSSLAVIKTSAIYAPIQEGALIGTVDYVFEGRVLFSGNLIAARSVAEGVLATTENPSSPDSSAPIGEATPSGLIASDATPAPGNGTEAKKDNSWILYVVIAAVALIVVLCLVVFIIRANNERKRRLARARRRKQMQARLEMQQRNTRRYE